MFSFYNLRIWLLSLVGCFDSFRIYFDSAYIRHLIITAKICDLSVRHAKMHRDLLCSDIGNNC